MGGKEKEKEEGFKGLSREELMQFANDPFWVKLRWVLFILFWIIWVAMLAASVVIIIYAPKCPSPEAKQWWQKGPVYKSNVQDFPDADGNKAHDLKDVKENIDYLVKFRAALEQAEADSGVEKVLMVDALSEPLSEISGVGAGNPVHLHIDEDLLPDEAITVDGIKKKLDAFIKKQPCEGESCAWPAFTLKTTSHGADKSDALTMLKMLLPGTVVSEAGEEYGLSPDQYPPADREEPALQQHLALYNLLTSKLRHQDAILFGKLKPEDSFLRNNKTVFGLVRVKKGSPGYLFLINLGPTFVEIDLSKVQYLPDDIRVLDAGDVEAVAPPVAAAEGEIVLKRFPTSAVPLEPGQAKIFNFVPKFS